SPTEKAQWFRDMLTTVPGGIDVNTPLPSEPMINGIFEKPLPQEASMRNQLATDLLGATQQLISGDAKGAGKDLARAKTLIFHFLPVWGERPGAAALMYKDLTDAGG